MSTCRPSIATRLNGVRITPFARIESLVAQLRKIGRSVVDFSTGEPDFNTPQNVQIAAVNAIESGEIKYTAVGGTGALKAAIALKFKRENGLHYTPEQIIAGAGAKAVLFNALAATVNPGDEVIIPAPYFPSYPDMVAVCEGIPVIIECAQERGFKLQADQLEKAITDKTKWLILNSPNNPMGHVYTGKELKELARVLLEKPTVSVLSDDIYEHILFDGSSLPTMAQIEPRLLDRTLTVNGMSKTYSMTGWRIGYAAGPVHLVSAMTTLQSQSTTHPCSISQAAAVEAITGPQDVISERKIEFRQRRDFIVAKLNDIPQLHCANPSGAFYVFPSCAGAIGQRTKGGKVIENDSHFSAYLLESEGVAVVPGSAFGMSPHFRLSYACSMGMLEEGCVRIRRACAGLSP
ncbi:pyridoxal phosphate-dependent aminotransferase [Bradyrhizobium zhanjiangense]|uniref:Aminotransferase n=1 Tax=Bradyrhizobium zhanjiangense TaxID=1325107 RepID=A0A4Q0Q4E5_9BRAD|nr:pyridoxal phosphate-dependent aminotransferase [Bradyrhizobium zhanjiangense]RXG83671.1 pyridoxal phosphate-dependent aminotransferase [Bradyrhizobium zhanjiangense]